MQTTTVYQTSKSNYDTLDSQLVKVDTKNRVTGSTDSDIALEQRKKMIQDAVRKCSQRRCLSGE